MMTTTTRRLIETSIAILDQRIDEVQAGIEKQTATLDDLVRRRTALRDQRRHLEVDLGHADRPE
ncbi:hypothetical protein [Agrococcus jejuensis]|uniref:hypothetical protein n=1 Tax=Agrococcus jejuensis TaxID=399736 RepID=UPI00119CAE7D|nr:hypothetical protein [Agrococcus jejuensis]